MQYFWECNIGLLVFYLGYLWLREDTFFQRNRFYLIFTSILALVLPLLPYSFFPENILSSLVLPLFTKTQSSLKITSENFYFQTTFWSVYFLGVAVMSLRLGFKLWKINQFIQQFPKEKCREYLLIKTEGEWETFSFFKYLFWDNTQALDETEAKQMRLHELAHIQQRHTYDKLYFEVLKVVFWFNPIVYLYSRELHFTQEYIADNFALQGEESQGYHVLLAKTAFAKAGLSLINAFKKTEIRSRLNMLTKAPSREWKLLKIIVFVPLTVLLFWINSPSSLNSQGKENTSTQWASIEGGLDSFYQELEKVLEYPPEAIENRKEGRVVLQFLITPKGEVKDLKVIKSFDAQCSKAALKAFKKVNVKWVSGQLNGQKVAQKITLPIYFKLD